MATPHHEPPAPRGGDGRERGPGRWLPRRIALVSAIVSVAAALLVTTSCADADAEGDPSAAGGSTAAVVPAGDSGTPQPPRIPDDFTWSGRYIVPDLDVEVPFTWHGNGGDFQMIAGGEDHPIHFTNLIHEGELYTFTYRWPDVPRRACSHVGAFTLDELNAGLADASHAGRETLHGVRTREVNHFRSVGVIDLPPGLLPDTEDAPQIRLPLMSGDIYTDVDDPTKIWQLLHFGVQNLYDPNLDEWIVIDEIDGAPGSVTLPDECRASHRRAS